MDFTYPAKSDRLQNLPFLLEFSNDTFLKQQQFPFLICNFQSCSLEQLSTFNKGNKGKRTGKIKDS